MSLRDSLVAFTRRRSSDRTSTTSGNEGVQDVLLRLHAAEREVARTIESLEHIATLLRGADAPGTTKAPHRRGPRNDGHTQTRTEDLSRVKRAL